MQKARKFLTERVNAFLTQPKEIEVMSCTGWEVSYRGETTEEYKKHHMAFLKNHTHQDAFNDFLKYAAPSWYDDIAWHVTLHQDQRMLVLKYGLQLEVYFLNQPEFLLLKPLAVKENRLIDRRQGPEADVWTEASTKAASELYKLAAQATEEQQKEINGGEEAMKNVRFFKNWGYLGVYQRVMRQVNKGQNFGFVNETTLDNVIPFNEAKNQIIM